MSEDMLKIRAFSVKDIVFDTKYRFSDGHLAIPETISTNLPADFQSITIRIIKPHHLDVQTNTIMDVCPISTKVLGEVGNGVTHTLTGAYFLITGADTTGIQLHDFGASNGLLKDKLSLGKAGTPGEDDYMIFFDVLLKPSFTFDRQLVTTIFTLADQYLQPIRNILKMINGRYADETHEYSNESHPGKPKVVVVKEVAGQGAMYDNLLFPDEPSGMADGVSIIDMNNFPVLLTPNEYRDGAIRAMV